VVRTSVPGRLLLPARGADGLWRVGLVPDPAACAEKWNWRALPWASLVALRGYCVHGGFCAAAGAPRSGAGTGEQAAVSNNAAASVRTCASWASTRALDEAMHVAASGPAPSPSLAEAARAPGGRDHRRGAGAATESVPLRELLAASWTACACWICRATSSARWAGAPDSLRASWLIFGQGFRKGPLRTVVKRLFDIVVAVLLLGPVLP